MPDFSTTVATLVSEGHDLTLRQCAVLLRVVEQRDPQTIRGMAAKLHVSKPAVTRAVDRLTVEGLAQRQDDPADRRSVLVVPTDAGRDWVARLNRRATGVAA